MASSSTTCRSKLKLCTTATSHFQWGIEENLPLLRQRDIKQQTVSALLAEGNVSVSDYFKKKRILNFCKGCVTYIEKYIYASFSTEFDTFLKRQKVKDDSSSEDDSKIDSVGSSDDDEANDHNVDDVHMGKDVLYLEQTDLHEQIFSLPQNLKNKLAYSLGLSVMKDVLKSADNSSLRYKDIQYMVALDVDSYYKSQDKVIRSFLNGVTASTDVTDSTDKQYSKTKIVESVMNLVKPAVYPLHFRETLVLYNTTKSKSALKMMSKCAPYTSYDTVKSWLESLSLAPDVPRPVGDIIVAIDNNQILKKKWAIRVENICYQSVVTMVVAFELDATGTVQFDPSLAPVTWRQSQVLEQDLKKLKEIDRSEAVRNVHYNQHLLPFIAKRLLKVVDEQEFVNGCWQDVVDIKVREDEQKQTSRKCILCQHENKKTARKCQGCGENLTHQKVPSNADAKAKTIHYRDVRVKVAEDETGKTSLHREKKMIRDEYSAFGCKNGNLNPKTFVLRPSMVNPNSYESVRKCLLDVGKQVGIKKYDAAGDREFVFIFCDGVPYNLIQRVICCTYKCHVCDQMLNSKTEAEKHIHQDTTLEFHWVLVFPGGGHIEMNMLRAIVDLLWPICWRDMVMLFNFRSEAALRSAMKVSDHHKGWTIARIFRNAVVDELVVPYIREELAKNEDEGEPVLSSSKFLGFVAKASNPNYTFIADITFEFIDAMFMFRAGVRCGRTDMIHAGRAIFAKLWCGRRHPQYRELHVQDTIQRLQMPEEVLKLAEKSMSLNMSGVDCTGEAPDFRLEEINKKAQSFMPLVPKTSDWVKVCANLTTLTDLKNSLAADKGMGDTISVWNPKKPQESEDEELAVRAMFRRIGYLTSPKDKRTHVSVSDEKLNPELVNFVALSDERYGQYVDAVAYHNQNLRSSKPAAVQCIGIDPVLITQKEVEESNKVESKTNLQLEHLIEEKIANICDDELQGEWKAPWDRSVKNKSRKKEYIEFLEQLTVFINVENEDSDEEVESDTST